MSGQPIGLGVIGLGRAFTLMLPTLRADARFALVAAADPDTAACERFAADFNAKTYTAERPAAGPDTAALAADRTAADRRAVVALR